MEGKLLQRSEVQAEFKWRIEDIYPSDEEWEKAYEKLKEDVQKECTKKGHLQDSSDVLLTFLEKFDEQDEMLEKIYVYAYMRLYEDMADAKHQAMAAKASSLSVDFSKKYSFMESEILSIDEEKLRCWMSGALKKYEHYLEDILAEKPHTLSEKEEAILAGARMMSTAPQDIFSKFNNADLKFGEIKGEDGKLTQLTLGRFVGFMQSQNRKVRKEAFEKLYEGYEAFGNTLAATYEANVKQAIFYANVRNYESTIQMYLSNNFIPTDVYDRLIETVNDNLGLMHKYVRLRKKALKVDELHMYDVYAPMLSDYSMHVSYDEAKEMVLKGLAPLGKEYVSLLKQGFDEGWVDVYENQGKRSGAFSWGEYQTHPYVCMNFTNTLDDVFTLAHEMGHALHTYHSNKHQPHIYAGYRIFVAEVASTCNEVLLMRWFLDNCEDDKARVYLLNHFLEQFKGTLFRQTMFAEFERKTHAMEESGEMLNLQNMNALYHELNERYFGKDMVIDSQIDYEWSRIPHLYTPFYVYQYATGFSAAISIATKILAGDEKTRKGYFQFLSSGSSLHPLELMELCGVDMKSKKPVEAAMETFKELLFEIEKYIS